MEISNRTESNALKTHTSGATESVRSEIDELLNSQRSRFPKDGDGLTLPHLILNGRSDVPVEDQVHNSQAENAEHLIPKEQQMRAEVDDALLKGNYQHVCDLIKHCSKEDPSSLDHVMQAVSNDFNKVDYFKNIGSSILMTNYSVAWNNGELNFSGSYGGCYPGSYDVKMNADGYTERRHRFGEDPMRRFEE